jgi:hypothetical protein
MVYGEDESAVCIRTLTKSKGCPTMICDHPAIKPQKKSVAFIFNLV